MTALEKFRASKINNNKKEIKCPITYNSLDIRGVAAEPIIEEILFENKRLQMI
jgi:hypothetical protein